jgi:hypothetical protein
VIADVEGGGEHLQAAIRNAVQRNVLPSLAQATEIRFERAERDIWARGAASIAVQQYLAGTAVKEMEDDAHRRRRPAHGMQHLQSGADAGSGFPRASRPPDP